MIERELVSELDAWLDAWEGPDDYRGLVQCARDYIIGLQACLEMKVEKDLAIGVEAAYEIRAEVLEEAARYCESLRVTAFGDPAQCQPDDIGYNNRLCDRFAAGLRAMKDERHE